MKLKELSLRDPGPQVQPVDVLRDDASDDPQADQVREREVRQRGAGRRERDASG